MNNRTRTLVDILSVCLFCFIPYYSLISQERNERTTSPSFPNLIDNGNFENYAPQSSKEGWQLSPSNLFTWDTFSYSGDRALSIDASRIPGRIHQELNAVISYSLKNTKPGATYLFEVYLYRDRNITGVYPTVQVFGQKRILNDFWREEGWQKISLFFRLPARPVPGSEESLKIRIPKGGYRLWIDDLSLREFGVALLSPKTGQRLKGVAVDFAWEAPETDRLLSQKIILSRTRRFEPSRSLEFATDNDSDRSSACPVLEPGTWYWRVMVHQYNKLIAISSTASFVIEGDSSQPKQRDAGRETRPKDNAQQILNYDFFPIGIFNADSADYKELSEIGFNAAQISPEDAQSLLSSLSLAQKYGLKILISSFPNPATLRQLELMSAQRVSHFTLYEPRFHPLPEDLPRALFLAPWRHFSHWITGGVENSGALLGFFLADEPEGRGISPKAIYRNYQALRTIGFRQPGVIVLNRPWRATDYSQTADVIMADNYPVPFNPLSWLSECLDEIRRNFDGDPHKRVWAAIQALAWNDASDEVAQTGLGREPSPEEIRALSYLAIAHQARGIFFYTYRGRNHVIKDRGGLWKGVTGTVKELRTILPLLGARESEKTTRLAMECRVRDGFGHPAVHYTLRELPIQKENMGPGIYLIAVNSMGKGAEAKFNLNGLIRVRFANGSEAVDIFSGEKFRLLQGALRIKFPPYARFVLRLGDIPRETRQRK